MPPKLVAYVALAWVPHTLAYVAAPLLVSRLGARHGWRNGRPGAPNTPGLPLVAAGAALIGWAIVSHYRDSPRGVQATARPDYLVTTGAYATTRNPLYLGGGAMWAGWAVLLGSIEIAAIGTLLFSFLVLVGVPYEERLLHAKMGLTYDAYRAEVPRWLGFKRGRHS